MENYLSKSCQSSILLISFGAFGREGVSKFYNGKSASPARPSNLPYPETPSPRKRKFSFTWGKSQNKEVFRSSLKMMLWTAPQTAGG